MLRIVALALVALARGTGVVVHLDDGRGWRTAGGFVLAAGIFLLAASGAMLFGAFFAGAFGEALLIGAATSTAFTIACGVSMIGVGAAMLGAEPRDAAPGVSRPRLTSA